MDSTGRIAIQWISEKTNRAIKWIVIYPVDNLIHLSKNLGYCRWLRYCNSPWTWLIDRSQIALQTSVDKTWRSKDIKVNVIVQVPLNGGMNKPTFCRYWILQGVWLPGKITIERYLRVPKLGARASTLYVNEKSRFYPAGSECLEFENLCHLLTLADILLSVVH